LFNKSLNYDFHILYMYTVGENWMLKLEIFSYDRVENNLKQNSWLQWIRTKI
jgi:hypothetical protein